ncbi:MAG: hypothetical protein GWN30_21715, partial [Gammaproteobacteria bacterium]|nr:hypothetical protein [candidate division Zixibacteria bacterium]NIW47267.1 hypothetical protein [Gammaproteobacteria bacterium]
MRKLLVFTGILLAIIFGLRFSAIQVDSKSLESPRDIGGNISLPLIQSGFDLTNQDPTATIEPTQTPEPTSDTTELIPIDNATGT